MGFRHAALFFIIILISGVSYAQVPDQINYQGSLADNWGNPVPDGTYTMRFYLFDAQVGGGQLDWNYPNGEEQSVLVIKGIYNIQLGSEKPLNPQIFAGGKAWLEVAVLHEATGVWETMSPRQQLTSVPYALRAGDAQTLGGQTILDLNAAFVNQDEAGAVTTAMIRDNTITASDLATNSVAGAEIADGAVSESELADNAVTAGKLAPDTVSSAHIIDGAVTGADLAEAYVKKSGDAIQGAHDGFALSVSNTSTGATARGIYARGSSYGLYAEEVGDGDVGIYTPDFVHSGGLRSNEDSYLWFPGLLGIKGNISSSEISHSFNGSITIKKTGATGNANIFMPLALPGQLFGQNVTVKKIRIYYKCLSASNYIDRTWLNRQSGASTYMQMADITNNYTSTTDSFYEFSPSPNELTADQGMLTLHIYLRFNNLTDYIRIGGVQVRLGHN